MRDSLGSASMRLRMAFFNDEIPDMSIGVPEFPFLIPYDFDLSLWMPPTTASEFSDGDLSLYCQPSVLPLHIHEGAAPLEKDGLPWEEWIEDEYMDADGQSDRESDYVIVHTADVEKAQEVDAASCSAIENQPLTTSRNLPSKQTRRPRRRKNVQPHPCGMCKEEFGRPRDLNRHVKRHTRPLHCQQCDVSMAERRDLNRHYWATHPDFARRLGLPPLESPRCRVCGTKFTRKDNLTRHVRRSHEGGGRKVMGAR